MLACLYPWCAPLCWRSWPRGAVPQRCRPSSVVSDRARTVHPPHRAVLRLRRVVAVLLGVLLLQLTLQESAWACVWMPHAAVAGADHAGRTPGTPGEPAAGARSTVHPHGAVGTPAGAAIAATSPAMPGRGTVQESEPGMARVAMDAVRPDAAGAARAERHDADDHGGRPCLPGTAHLGFRPSFRRAAAHAGAL